MFYIGRNISRLMMIALAAVSVSGTICIGGTELILKPPLWVDRDDHPIERPQEKEVSEIYAIAYNTWFRHLNLCQKMRDHEALNVNAWDEVPDSTWFTNRIGLWQMSDEDVLEQLEGTAPASGEWKVTRANSEGYTPKFNIKDEEGRRYVLKFDLPDAIERNSAAERISTLIMFACGYNVPHNSVVLVDPEELAVDKDAYYKDLTGKRHPLTAEFVEDALARVRQLPDGRYRGLASLYLEGRPIGPFVYHGTREDDPNDIIPHEFRRELRGLRVIASWINHADVKDVNALDMFIPTGAGRGYVKHFLLDFGSTLGSGDYMNGPYRIGHEYLFDGSAIGKSLLTFGAWKRPWEQDEEIRFVEVGHFDASLFEPAEWKPNYPNLAFRSMDAADGYWGAKIVTAFSDELIHRIVSEGRYGRPECARHVEETLITRRDAIGDYWLQEVTPLEDFVVDQKGAVLQLGFRDLAVERGYAEPHKGRYRFWVEDLGGEVVISPDTTRRSETKIRFRAPVEIGHGPVNGGDRFGRTPIFRIFVQSKHPNGGWALPVGIFVGHEDNEDRLKALGWAHGLERH
jgi:hypothetical protein